ncbi:MAG: tRNA (adenosine(37)-N6)-dimethylallyltransferase MiaA [Salibacteraceae bacterium]|nr:tRNA (adenosine(37)-N6)-dimethylallyltransferase MiaA [Salibacteraceae bacterium]MDP4686081.1 tRNA (adenosine(37)-N6)-dimethylallyltransferase MiaA [Salibacteraceae bacterium]MDP4764597.1 tRNA (adenosine(37)-N6)-dimethylallyltransferase MiaA [Salibacteraceae bacterium]MDP4844402.1 tRNA (adenosine(37)-N6)-dimethylallyltransferase MiaA [Salibacteraceae bacterium]MDP4935196.1 tRNA (adenosine(37)-N6)-dimethylallyltransferase MiaA [Salibacteraceae bacterium]
MQGTLIIISGPTASGKTSLSIELAKKYDAEIISADARQFYVGMDIGTAKVSKSEQAEIPHHFLDVLAPNESYNAGKFETDVLNFLEDYFARKSVAILVGGSGLYINAVKNGFDPLPSTTPEMREKWSQLLFENGIEFLQKELLRLDPDYYDIVDLNNHQRVQRALEAIDQTGKTFTSLRTSSVKNRSFKMVEIQIIPEREMLYDRINERVDQMMRAGLLEEVKSLVAFKDENALQTVGYKELFDHLSGVYSLEEAIEKIKQHTRNFAKRQYTWFKKNAGDLILSEPDLNEASKHLKKIISV